MHIPILQMRELAPRQVEYSAQGPTVRKPAEPGFEIRESGSRFHTLLLLDTQSLILAKMMASLSL